MNTTKDISPEERAKWQVPAMEVPLWLGKQRPYCVVIPVINEGERIKSLLKRMKAEQISEIADIIIVDGGSADGSLELEALQRVGVRGLVIKTGPGKLSAQLRCAYAFALDQGYEGIVTIDGNDKDDPEAIPKFIEALNNGVDFVQASRFIVGGVAENTPKSRDFAIRLIHAPALSLSSGFRWTDTTQGFRAYSRKMLLDPSIAPFRDVFRDYELLAYLSHRAPQLNYHCVEIGSVRRYPKGEVPTKISAIRGNLKVLKTLLLACAGRYNSENALPTTLLDARPIIWLAVIGFLFSILAFFPGWMSPDSFAQYFDAKRGVYIDWHPVLMAWWWRQLDKIYQGPALFLIQNLLLYWGAWYLLAMASRRWIRRYAYLIPLLGFWPGLLYPLGQIWKDIAFACSMFFAWAMLINAYAQSRKLKLIERCSVFALGVFAFGVKTNGLVVLPFLFFFWVFIEGWEKSSRLKQGLLTIIFSLSAVLAATLIVPRDQIIRTHPFQYTQTYDLLAISVKTESNLLPKYVTDRVGNTPDQLKKLYWAGGNDLLFYNTAGNLTTIESVELQDLHEKWISALKNNPWSYIDHRLENFKSLLRWNASFAASVAAPTIGKNEYGFLFSKNSFSDSLSVTPEKHPMLFFPWAYISTLIFSSLIIFSRTRKHRTLVFCITSSVLSFTLPHFFIAPAADYRYLYYATFPGVIITFFLFVTILNKLARHLMTLSRKR